MPQHSGKKCPPGHKLVNGKCVKMRDRNGMRRLDPSPAFGLFLPGAFAVAKARRAVVKGLAGRTPGLVGQPFYLLAKEKEQFLALGVAMLTQMAGGDGRVSMSKTFRAKINLLGGWRGGDLVPKSMIRFAEKKAAPKPTTPKDEPGTVSEKIMSEHVGSPLSNGGMHDHILVRSEGRTWNDGRHFHTLIVEGVGKLVSDIDGEHLHSLGEGDRTGEEDSAHTHVFGMPDGTYVKTEPGGSHGHDVGVHRTAHDGAHSHEVKIEGKRLMTLSVNEEAMEAGPGPFDGPEAGRGMGGPEPMELGFDAMMAILEKDFKGTWDKAGPTEFKSPEEIKAWAEKQTAAQSIVLSKDVFKTREAASKWVADHGFHAVKVDETTNTFRFRQFDPGKCKKNTFRNKRLTRGVSAVICVSSGAKAPEGLRRDTPAGNDAAKRLEKKVLEQSKAVVHSRPSGFSYELKGSILFAFDQPAKGAREGSAMILMERQRLGEDAMKQAPKGAMDASEIIKLDPAAGRPQELAMENMGSRIFVLSRVKGSTRLAEVDVLLAVIDPTKSAPGGCGCGGK